MLFSILLGAPNGQEAPFFIQNLIPIMFGVFILFWLIVLRPAQRRQEQERLALLNSLDKGDRVLTTSGIYGTVVSSDKEDEVTIKVDDNVKIKMTRGSVVRNLSKEELARTGQAGSETAK